MNYPAQFSPFSLRCRRGTVTFRRPAVMGILNATADSFYDGGRYNRPDALLSHARELLQQGADILDLGVMSSRRGAAILSPADVAAKLAPLVALLRTELPDALISVDTCQSLPATRAVEAGADIINDISGGQLDPQMLPTVVSLGVPYILMHMRGTPATMLLPENTRYDDIVDDLARYYDQRLNLLSPLGPDRIILDPGLGFAKTVEQNHELLHRLPELIRRFPQYPMLVALSNKSMITRRLADFADHYGPATPPLPDSELGTLVLNTVALSGGASLLRVHTPRPTRLAISLLFGGEPPLV
ncbi:MAG: dihydropteroate synthase [Bacteroidales bacterium]|nr:dihydropteroate synthase [Bacteroidales bacterium]